MRQQILSDLGQYLTYCKIVSEDIHWSRRKVGIRGKQQNGWDFAIPPADRINDPDIRPLSKLKFFNAER